jgi:hypothetical protein
LFAAEPADTHSIFFFHPSLSLAHNYHASSSFNWASKKEKKQVQSLSLSELVGNLGEEVVGVDGVVDERLPAVVMDASSEGRPLAKALFHRHAEPRLIDRRTTTPFCRALAMSSLIISDASETLISSVISGSVSPTTVCSRLI